MIDFPSNPVTGQAVNAPNGGVYLWDGDKWTNGSGPGPSVYLPLTGGVMYGAITLPGNAVSSLQAVPLQQVNSAVAGGSFLPLSGNATVTGPTAIHYDTMFTPSTNQSTFSIYSNVSGTMGAVGGVSPFSLIVASDSVDSTGNPGASFFAANIGHNFGGTKGGHGTLNVTQTQTADVADTTGTFINPVNIYLDLEHSGKNLANGIGLAAGVYYGAGASGWNIETVELGMTRAAGSTCLDCSLLTMVYTNLATTHASGTETALNVVATAGSATGLNNLISVGRPGGQWPLDSNGWILQTFQQINNNPGNTQRKSQACAGGLDFWNVNFSTSAFRTSGITLGNGVATIGSARLFNDVNGLIIDAAGSVGAIASVAAGGSAYQVNDQLYDGFGGIIQVTAIGGGGAVTAASYIVGREPYNLGTGPASVVTTGGSGSGATLNVTWTIRNRLTLNSSGGLTYVAGACDVGGDFQAWSTMEVTGAASLNGGLGLFNGTPVTAKPTVSGAKGSNAALASLMTALAAYGLVTDSTTA